MNILKRTAFFIFTALIYASCSSSEDDIANIPVVEGSTVIKTEMGADQSKQVYVNLNEGKSGIAQVKNNLWDLAFFNGSDFVVKINYTIGARALATGAASFNELSQEKIDEIKKKLPGGYADPVESVDNQNGSFEETAIARVSANAKENQVYLLKLGSVTTHGEQGPVTQTLGWRLIQLRQNGSEYTLEYSEVGEGKDFKATETIKIRKRSGYNFSYLSLKAKKTVEAEPKSESWDILFTKMSDRAEDFGGIAYTFTDYVLINTLGGTQTAEIRLKEGEDWDAAFDAFTAENAAGLEFTKGQNKIGRTWRALNFDAKKYEIKKDRFYVIKDVHGYMYKLRLTSLYDKSGKRSGPEFQYVHLK
ncbi:MAG: HmuY family protein [Cytophagales bacterium]|nr:HmuY family protein [Cytophagales bacterium]